MKFPPSIHACLAASLLAVGAPQIFAQGAAPSPSVSPSATPAPLTTKSVASMTNAEIQKEAESLQPSRANPVLVAKDDHATREHWRKIIRAYFNLPADETRAHPMAVDFPGAVADSVPRVTRSLDVALNRSRWHSTGLYAPPGKPLTISVSPEDAKRGLSIVIGAHTDDISNTPKWTRFPKISHTYPITQPETKIANPFGGLVYINVPRDPALGGWQMKTFGGYGWLHENLAAVSDSARVTIAGAVEAPYFELGKTTPEEWKKSRASAAPWGELATDRIILTLPSSQLAELDDPAPVMEFWNKIVDTEIDLAGWKELPSSPERMLTDRQISAGFMHSGYPIMTPLSVAPMMVSLEEMQHGQRQWGFFHELGHNHQGQAYTVAGPYTEVTVNLFSMYLMQKLIGRDGLTGHPALDHLDNLLRSRLGSEHKQGPWENLAMYIVLIKQFGWEPLQQTMASYVNPTDAPAKISNAQKEDEWVRRYSQAVGKNLVDYFAAFGFDASDKTKAALKNLPVWKPSSDFPKNYETPAPTPAPAKK